MLIEFGEDLRLELSETILKSFSANEQKENTNEKGGILLGKKELNTNTYVITEITLPSKKDSAGRNFFIRSKKTAQKVINDRWNESEGIINYLGEWHTHSCEHPTPSHTDRLLIEQIKKDKVGVLGCFFMIIIGQKDNLYIEAIKTFNDVHLCRTINYGDEING